MDLEKHARKIEAIHLVFLVFAWATLFAMSGYGIYRAANAADEEDVRAYYLFALVFPLCLFGAVSRWVRRKRVAES